MSHLLRQFCVGLAVTLMVALQGFGAISAEHKIEHAVQFPGIAYSMVSADDHDHDRGRPMMGAAPGDAWVDVDTIPDETPVKPHHHHAGADHLLVFDVQTAPTDASIADVTRLEPTAVSIPPGAVLDALHQPPRQNA